MPIVGCTAVHALKLTSGGQAFRGDIPFSPVWVCLGWGYALIEAGERENEKPGLLPV